MQPIPTPALVVIQTTLALGILVELLDGPAAVRQFDQPWQWGIRGQGTEIPFDLTACAWHRPLAQQPALGSRADAVMAGGELRAARRPVPAHGDELFAQAPLVVLAPGDRLPTICGQGFEHGFGCIQRGRTRLLRLATIGFSAINIGGVPIYADPYATNNTSLWLPNWNYLGFKMHQDAEVKLNAPHLSLHAEPSEEAASRMFVTPAL